MTAVPAVESANAAIRGMSSPIALDLFCGAGGVARGLQRAGFFVVGVDNRPQPRYAGDLFIQGDALNPPVRLEDFDLIWASPPCQAYSVASQQERLRGKTYPDLVSHTRDLLAKFCGPTVIENVPRAPIRADLRLVGWQFEGLRVIRERWFELSWFMLSGKTADRPRGLLSKGFVSVAGHGTQGWAYKKGLRWLTANMRDAMGIDWMTRAELSQAIPPAYSEYIGRAALAAIERRAAA